MTPEQEAKFKAAVAKMSPDERAALEQAAWLSLAKSQKVIDTNGKKVCFDPGLYGPGLGTGPGASTALTRCRAQSHCPIPGDESAGG